MADDISDDVLFEPDDDASDTIALAAKLKKVRTELKETQGKRDEYLTGWQRAKADAINSKNETMQVAQKVTERAIDDLVLELITVLDSFDIAAQSESWSAVSVEWRSGVSLIQTQLLDVLSRRGITRYGKVGDVIDHSRFEAVQEVNDGDMPPHSVTHIVRYGYAKGDRVLRAAQVVVRG